MLGIETMKSVSPKTVDRSTLVQRKDGSIIIPGICIVASSRTTRLL